MAYYDGNGVHLYFEFHGNEGPCIVLMNGLFQSTENWLPVIRQLKGFRILLYDMRGQGRSSVPGTPCTPETHVEDLHGLLRFIEWDSCSFAGMAGGAMVAQLFAVRYPHMVDKLILSNTAARMDYHCRAKIKSWMDSVQAGGLLLRAQVTIPWGFGSTFMEEHPELLADATLERLMQKAPSRQAHIQLVEGLLMARDMREELKNVNCPTLVVSGDEDLIFPEKYGRELAMAIPGAQLEVLEGVGHSSHVEKPQRLGQLMQTFLTA